MQRRDPVSVVPCELVVHGPPTRLHAARRVFRGFRGYTAELNGLRGLLETTGRLCGLSLITGEGKHCVVVSAIG